MNKNYIKHLAILLVLTMLLAACGKDKYEPKAVNPEIDRCATCNMAVGDDPFATQVVTKEGQSFKFDDVGCMHEWIMENGKEVIGAAYVRDYHTKSWVLYEQAYYVYDASFKTPMAYGIVSFKNESEAKAFIEEQGKGKLMTASELDSHTWERNREMMEMHMEGMNEHSHSHDADEGQAHDEEGGNAGSDHEPMHGGVNGSGGNAQ